MIASRLQQKGSEHESGSVLSLPMRLGLQKPYGIFIYPGTGSADGMRGDHEIIAPAYKITTTDVDFIVQRVCKLIEDFFDEYDAAQVATP